MAQDIMVTLQKLANENTAKTFKFNREEASTTRAWQERMSNTAHQREVKDLIKAGLNPVLSSGGSGAPAYGASSASGTADSAVNALGNVEASRTSASAMRYSANQSLKAAQAAAAAQRYAADQSAAAQRYAADMHYKTEMDKPVNSIYGAADKYIGNNVGKAIKNYVAEVSKDPRKALWDTNSKSILQRAIFANDPARAGQIMSKDLTTLAKNFLNKNGYIISYSNLGYMAKYLYTGNRKYLSELLAKPGAYNPSARSVASTFRFY